MSISISLVRTLIDAVERAGVAPDELFERAGFDRTLLDDPAARIDVPRHDRMQELAVELTGDPALGLHMGEQAPLAALNVVGHMVAHCRTIRETLDLLFRYHRIVSDCAPSRLVEEGERVLLLYNFPRTTAVCSRVRGDFGMTLLFGIAGRFGDAAAHIEEVRFEHERPDYADEYRRIFGGKERFGCEHTAIVARRSGLDVSQRHANPHLHEVLQEQAERMLRRLDDSLGMAQQVEDLIFEHYHELEPDMDSVARRFGMSARSLRRRLATEDECFAKVQQRALARVAEAVLDEPQTTIQEAAYRLGFAEASSFHRAFKRWTGRTPGEYRQRPA